MWHLGWSEGAWSEGDESPVVVASGTSTVSGVGASVAEAAGAAAGTSAAAALSPPGIALGKARVRQKVYHDPLETDDQGGSLTTWATDLTVSSVSSGSDTLTFAADHGMITTEGPYRVSTSGSYPGGLDGTTNYWMVRSSSTVVQLATSGQNAKAGTVVDITSSGSGTLTLVRSITTNTTGSAFILFSALGTWANAPEAPTDNMGNTYSALAGSPITYSNFPASKAGCWGVTALTSTGGAGANRG